MTTTTPASGYHSRRNPNGTWTTEFTYAEPKPDAVPTTYEVVDNAEFAAARQRADALKAGIRRADLDAEPVEDDGTSYSVDTDLAQGR